MHNTSDMYFMMIEPTKEHYNEEGVDDSMTRLAEYLETKLRPQRAHLGSYQTPCGNFSSQELATPMGRITNQAMVLYVKHYREGVPQSELVKLQEEIKHLHDNKPFWIPRYHEQPGFLEDMKRHWPKTVQKLIKALAKERGS